MARIIGILLIAAGALGLLYVGRVVLQVQEAPPQPSGLEAAAGRHCANCGWIEAKREIALGLYEYTLRMPGGSSTVFEETLPTTWRVGERVGVIEGRSPAPN